jgi:hypothetical protein
MSLIARIMRYDLGTMLLEGSKSTEARGYSSGQFIWISISVSKKSLELFSRVA